MASTSMLSSISKRLDGKVALITGGASGIGNATAKLFAQHGACVVIADIQDEHGHALSNELGGSSISSYIHCDVTSESDVKNAVDTTVNRYGKLDIMFNNAGIGLQEKQIVDSETSNFEKVLSVNLMGYYFGMKHAARVMIPARYGSIISTASVASLNPNGTGIAYSCSKHAALALMKSCAIDLGKYGIRVNCVSPSGVATPMMTKAFGVDEEVLEEHLARHAALKGVKLKAYDVAQAVMYLGSDESRFVSGHNLVVDGAFSLLSPLDFQSD